MRVLIGFALLSVVSSLPTTNINNTKIDDMVSNFNFTRYKQNLVGERLYYDELAQNCTHVFIVSGGTTASNSGENYQYNTSNNVLMWNYSLPGWQLAKTQLAGCDGDGYSPWVRFAHNITRHTPNTSVCLFGTARQGSCIHEWHPFNGKYYYLLDKAVNISKNYGKADLFWSQGECDAKYNTPNYDIYLSDVVNSHPHNNWFISETSYTPWTYYKVEDQVRNGQSSIVHQLNNAYAGPNTDSLCIEYRFTDNTFNSDGQMLMADGWTYGYLAKSDTFTLGNGRCFFKEVHFLDAFFTLVFYLGFVLMCTACCVGTYFIVRMNEQRVTKVYYSVIPYNGEKARLLDSSSNNTF